MRRSPAAPALLLTLALVACHPTAQGVAEGGDALAALAARAESHRYDGPFWAREAHRGSTLWARAKGFCLAHREDDLPNCRAVERVVRWEQPPTLAPLAPLPPLAPAPPALQASPPPVWQTSERGYVAADVEALKRWEAELLAAQRRAARGGAR